MTDKKSENVSVKYAECYKCNKIYPKRKMRRYIPRYGGVNWVCGACLGIEIH